MFPCNVSKIIHIFVPICSGLSSKHFLKKHFVFSVANISFFISFRSSEFQSAGLLQLIYIKFQLAGDILKVPKHT